MGKLFSKSKNKNERYSSGNVADQSNAVSPPDGATGMQQCNPVHSDAVVSVAYAKPGLCLSGSKDNTVVLFDYNHRQIVHRWTGHEKEITKVVYAHELDAVFSSSRDQTACMWRVGEAAPLMRYTGHSLVVTGLTLNSENTQLCTGSRDNCIRLWDINTGQCLANKQISRNLVTDIKWAKNSDIVVQTSEDKLVRVWDMRSQEVVHEFPRKQYIQTSCDISEDGNYCVSASNGFSGNGCEATLWDMRAVNAVHEFKGHSQTTGACMFFTLTSAGGHLVATSSNDQSIKLWNRDTADCIATSILSGSGPITSLALIETDKLCAGTFHTGVQMFQLSQNSAEQLDLKPSLQF